MPKSNAQGYEGDAPTIVGSPDVVPAPIRGSWTDVPMALTAPSWSTMNPDKSPGQGGQAGMQTLYINAGVSTWTVNLMVGAMLLTWLKFKFLRR